jgi:hypothetical protein
VIAVGELDAGGSQVERRRQEVSACARARALDAPGALRGRVRQANVAIDFARPAEHGQSMKRLAVESDPERPQRSAGFRASQLVRASRGRIVRPRRRPVSQSLGSTGRGVRERLRGASAALA